MSRAVIFEQYGPAEVLRVEHVPMPVPGPGELLVRVLAAGVSPFDVQVRAGLAAHWLPLTFPHTLGTDFAGIVEETGAEVVGFGRPAHATHVAVPAGQLVPKPHDMPWSQAGALAASGQTALTVLKDLNVGKGDTLLIHAAAGGVGSLAVQIARAWGATVIGTASERNHDYLRELGAIPVSYGEGLVDRVKSVAPQGVDVVLDAAGGDAAELSLALVTDPGRVGSIANKQASTFGARTLGSRPSVEQLVELIELYRNGHLRVTISSEFPLEQAAMAHREVETGHVRGKVVLVTQAVGLDAGEGFGVGEGAGGGTVVNG